MAKAKALPVSNLHQIQGLRDEEIEGVDECEEIEQSFTASVNMRIQMLFISALLVTGCSTVTDRAQNLIDSAPKSLEDTMELGEVGIQVAKEKSEQVLKGISQAESGATQKAGEIKQASSIDGSKWNGWGNAPKK